MAKNRGGRAPCDRPVDGRSQDLTIPGVGDLLEHDAALDDRRLHAARIRQTVRNIDAQLREIQTEERLFQRCGFGSDVHDIQLAALRSQREDLLAELPRLQLTAPRRSRFVSWLLVPPALGALLLQTLRPQSRRQPARRARPALRTT